MPGITPPCGGRPAVASRRMVALLGDTAMGRPRYVECTCRCIMEPSKGRQQHPLRRRYTCPECSSWVELLAGKRGLYNAHWRTDWPWY